jgi:uncharacterized membrane protein YdjX (TVP38/TMEM64 family)
MTTPGSPPPITLRRLGPAGIVAVFSAFMPLAGSFVLLYFAKTIAAYLQQDTTRGLLIYTSAFAVLAGLALLPTYAQAIIGGYIFGPAAIPAALLGFVGGSMIGYEIGRRASGDRIEGILKERPAWAAVRDAMVGRGFWPTLGIVTLVRLPPNSPFAMTNLVLSSSGVKRLPYVLGTLIGMTPRTALAVFLGKGLDHLTRESVQGAVPKPVVIGGIVAMLIVLGILGHIAKKAMARVTGAKGGVTVATPEAETTVPAPDTTEPRP